MLICSHKWCLHIGRHTVNGTHYRTCPKHTTQHVHEYLQAVHKRKYPEQHEFLKKARRGLD